MRIVLDDLVTEELKEYLLTQTGITSVDFSSENSMTVLDIKYNKKTNSSIIMKYIDLFLNHDYSILFEFDKETKGKFKTLKYIVDDMCCEYCHSGLVNDLFENDNIKSVKSNFNHDMPAYNIEFTIEYDENYKEEDLIKYIKDKYK